MNFVDVVEEIKNFSFEEKEQINFLISKYLIEEKRESIYSNYNDSLDEMASNKLEFTSDINRLKEMLNQ